MSCCGVRVLPQPFQCMHEWGAFLDAKKAGRPWKGAWSWESPGGLTQGYR